MEYSVRFKSSAMIKSLTTMVESKRLSVQLRPPHFKQEARRTEKIMRLPIKLIEKLNNLTNCEMNMYLWLCENQNDNGAVSGIRPSDFIGMMSKQSFYNALRGLKDKGLIRMGFHHKRHEYKISLNNITITVDNGTEFSDWKGMEKSRRNKKIPRTKIYYCHAYRSCERGSNENQNRMIRRFFPKGTNFDNVSKNAIKEVQKWMNDYPRKILGWLTPDELYNMEINISP